MSDLHAKGSLMENTSAEMSPVARQANAGWWVGWSLMTRSHKYGNTAPYLEITSYNRMIGYNLITRKYTHYPQIIIIILPLIGQVTMLDNTD